MTDSTPPMLRITGRAGRPALDLGREVHALLGLVFDATTVEAAAAHLRGCAAQGQRCVISTPNINFVIAAQHDPLFRDSVLQSDLSLADGAPILRIARWFAVPLPERVAGADLFDRLRCPDAAVPMKVFFFGGAEGVAERAAQVINGEAGGLRCVGFLAPGFGSVEAMSSDEIIARINAADAEFVVVSLGAAKGQAWIQLNRERLTAPLVCHLGAVVNFVAGGVRRAPTWLCRAGLEWCWRIKEEPGLWRRYAADAAQLLRMLWAARYGLRRAPHLSAATPAAWLEQRQERLTRFELRGVWSRTDLTTLRPAIAAALLAGHDVQFDLTAMTDADAAVLALLAVIDRWQVQPRALVACAAIPVTLQRRLAACGITQLFSGDARP